MAKDGGAGDEDEYEQGPEVGEHEEDKQTGQRRDFGQREPDKELLLDHFQNGR